MRFIGDIHGDLAAYTRAVGHSQESVQVGDFGFGFRHDHEAEVLLRQLGPQHRLIRGNHDDPAVCARQPNWIADGTVEVRGANTIMYLGGAWSIDQEWRRHNEHRYGKTWWEDEELSQSRLNEMIDIYKAARPTVMITHDCPERVQHAFFPHYVDHFQTRTGQTLEAMIGLHQPRLWIFGHHHAPKRDTINGCEFVCLDILETMDVDL